MALNMRCGRRVRYRLKGHMDDEKRSILEVITKVKVKGKDIPVTGHGGP
jgi:hypothetical protein